MESRYTYSRGRMNSTTIPSPPSPAASSPSLTQSASNSSSSPPQPTTPPRQPRPRYPDLGRVPLHRRGTSKTYERLEDLLREAGYKETRIFTPESDKHGVGQHDDDCSQSDYSNNKKPRQGVGAAVVGFLTGLVTGGGNMSAANGPSGSGESRQEDLGQQPSDNNPDRRPRLSSQTLTQSPTSPLANKYSSTTTYSRTNRNGSQSAESSEPQTPFMTSSIESLNDSTPKAYRRQTSYTAATAQTYSRSPSRPTTPSYQNTTDQYHAPLSTTSYNHQQQQPPPPQSRHHRLSAAQLQLQHQASWSSINTLTSNNVGLASAPSSGAAVNNMVSQAHLHGDQGTLNSGSGVVPAYGGSDISHNNHVIHNPQPSRAGTYLRHMVSTPSIPHPPPRPNSTPARHRIFSSSKTEESSDVEPTANGQQQPPLPRNWLDNVARAILFGVAITPRSSSTTPPSQPQPPHQQQQRILRATRSSLSQTTIARTSKTTCRSGLSDQTNTIPPSLQFLTPPALSTRLERGRAPCSQGVLKAQVVCRSAPGSRASSLSRQQEMSGAFIRDRSSRNGETGRRREHHQHLGGVGGGNDHKTRGRGRKKDKKNKKKKNKKKSSLNDDDEPTRVPSLSRTRIEGDGWQIHSHTLTHTSPPGIRPRPPNAHQHRLVSLSRSGTVSSSHSSLTFSDFNNSDANSTLSSDYDYDNSDNSDSDSDDEGELNLARMLVPPKRQQSIRSLRKHLHITSPSSTDISISSSTSTITAATTTTANGNAKLNPSSSRLHTSSSHSVLRPRIVSGAQSRLGGMREVSGRGRASGSEGTGEWEHEWRRGDYSSRRASEDDEEVESLTWLNRDRGGNGSQRSTTKSRLSLPVPWNTNA